MYAQDSHHSFFKTSIPSGIKHSWLATDSSSKLKSEMLQLNKNQTNQFLFFSSASANMFRIWIQGKKKNEKRLNLLKAKARKIQFARRANQQKSLLEKKCPSKNRYV